MRYLTPCLRRTEDGRYEQWERVVLRVHRIGDPDPHTIDDFAWVDVTYEFLINEENEKKNRELNDSNDTKKNRRTG